MIDRCNTASFYFCGLYVLTFFLTSVATDRPLIVTSYLEGSEADIVTAVRLSQVKPDIVNGVRSYSGFFNVNKDCGNNLFFWFFPADDDWEDKPVLLWLKGAPGSTILTGVFEEVGPAQFRNGKLVKIEHSWTSRFNVLFIDQSAGSGFSFTDKDCYPNSVEASMSETFTALKQFFVMFHQLKKNDFYIAGGYFVSHFGPALAKLILESDQQSDESNKIHLHGVLIMNGRTSAECHDFSGILYYLGIVSQKNRDVFKNMHDLIVEKVKEGKFSEAIALENQMFNKLQDVTKLPSIHNFAANDEVSHPFVKFIEANKVRKQIHVGNQIFNFFNEKEQAALLPEYFSSPKEGIEYIVKRDDVFVGFYHGQMEVINPYSAVNCFLKTVQWPEDEDFTKVHRNVLRVDGKVIGWTKVTGNFFHILVRKVGRYHGVELGETGMLLFETIFEPVKSNGILSSGA